MRYNITPQGALAVYQYWQYVNVRNFLLLMYPNRTVLRRLQCASGTYGMVAVPDKTGLLHPVVGRFSTGAMVRVVQPAEVRTAPNT